MSKQVPIRQILLARTAELWPQLPGSAGALTQLVSQQARINFLIWHGLRALAEKHNIELNEVFSPPPSEAGNKE